jgi:hypothetical protein
MIIIIPNILAMLGSLISMVLLAMIIPKIGGSIGLMIKLLILGIFFSVFIHAVCELATAFCLLSEQILMPIMGVLLSIGSLFFILASIVGLKSLKQR